MMKFNQWERNAEIAMRVYGSGIDFEERFYVCPDCGEVIYECDWSDEELSEEFCPICGFVNEEE